MRRRPHAALLAEAIRIRRRQPPPHPAECWGKVRDFPCLPLPEPLPPTPEEEMAPWDDPMIMSAEELAELVGL